MLKKKKYMYFILLIIIVILLFMFLRYINFDYKNPQAEIRRLKHFLERNYKYSVFILLGIYIIKPFLMIFPTWVLGVVSGAIYGSFKGLIISLIGCFLSATSAFYMAKFLGRDFVVRFTKGKLDNIDKILDKNGFKILFLMRLPVVFPYDALSLACGLTSIKYKDFILASVLGVIPEMIAYNFFGNSVNKSCYKGIYIPVIILMILIILSFKLKINDDKE